MKEAKGALWGQREAKDGVREGPGGQEGVRGGQGMGGIWESTKIRGNGHDQDGFGKRNTFFDICLPLIKVI